MTMRQELKSLLEKMPLGVLEIGTRVGLKRVQHLRKVDVCAAFLTNFLDRKQTTEQELLARPLFRGLISANGINAFLRLVDADVIRSDEGISIPPTPWNSLRCWAWLSQNDVDTLRVARTLNKTVDELEQIIEAALSEEGQDPTAVDSDAHATKDSSANGS